MSTGRSKPRPRNDLYLQQPRANYEVRFEARNGAGKIEKSYAVEVSDVLEMHLSVGDSTRIVRRQLDILKVMAIVDAGSNVTHEWKVDNVVKSDKAYFDTFDLPEAKVYTVAYTGKNATGTFQKSFEVQATERPLEISFSNEDATIPCKEGAVVEIIATVKYGGTGVQHEWKVDGVTVSTDAVFSRAFENGGPYTIAYHGVNSKNETVDRTWTVTIVPVGCALRAFRGLYRAAQVVDPETERSRVSNWPTTPSPRVSIPA